MKTPQPVWVASTCDRGGRGLRTPESPLSVALDRHTTVGRLWRAEGDKVRCVACGHRCLIAPGRRGVCKVRYNDAGQLRVPFGYVSSAACDPIEKKPFYHVLPGGGALTFGMLGCDFHCSYCQNWITSQALRDDSAGARVQPTTPERLVGAAQREGARLMVSSYNEPFITAEWAAEIFARAKPAGLVCAFVSNGNATPEALEFLRPWLGALKIDLKTFDDRRYRSLGGTLARVTETIREAHACGIWVEVVTLVVPGFNDTQAELRAMARFLVSVSADIPWHLTAFHPDYRMTEPRATEADDLANAAEIGVAEGLRFVYAGNLHGCVGAWEDTRCPGCGEPLVRRRGFQVIQDRLSPGGCCPRCGRVIPGIWRAADKAGQV